MVQYVLPVYTSISVTTMGAIFSQLFIVLDDVTYLLSIYFIYDFGYTGYRKLFDCCHVKMYKFCQKRHYNQNEQRLINAQ